MLVAIVRINKDNYYINLESRNDEFYYNVVLANNNVTRSLNEVEAKELIRSLMSCTNKKFDRHENGYDIYIDSIGNQRFFKNGRENFLMFYKNNGRSAVMYDDEKKSRFDFLAKEFKINYSEYLSVIVIASMIGFALGDIVSNAMDRIHYEEHQIVIDRRMTPELAERYIAESDGNITPEAKEYLSNDVFLQDVLDIADDSRDYILRKKLEDITIKYDKDACEEREACGFYNVINPNLITLEEDTEEIINNSLAHEFVHLMQDNNIYLYIREASAEMMAYEYYDSIATSYEEQRNNLRILMELIGPKTIMELNFKGDVDSFEKTIYNSLDEEKADKLLELFTASPAHDENIEKIDEEVYDLLDEMSYNLTGMRLNDVDNYTLKTSKIRQVYFNQHSKHLYEESEFRTNTTYIKDLTIDDVDPSKIANISTHTVNSSNKEEYEKYGSDSENDIYVEKNYYFNENDIKMDYLNNLVYQDDNEYTLSEAEEKGLINIQYVRKNKVETKSLDSLKDVITNNDDVEVRMLFDDNTMGLFHYIDGKKYGQLLKLSKDVVVPSLADKFSEQVKSNMLYDNPVLNVENNMGRYGR